MADAAGRLVHRRRRKFFEALGDSLIAYAEVALDEERLKREPLPDLPAELRFVWEWFLELHSKRDVGFGPARLKDREIAAWAKLRGHDLTLWLLGLIDRMDAIWFRAEVARLDKKTKKPGAPAVRDEAQASDPKGIGRILRNLAAHGAVVMKQKKKKKPA